MYNIDITEEVDIYELPPLDDKYKTEAAAEFTIGDAHGSAPKILYFLVKHGFAKNINPEDYKKFVAFCSKTPDEITLEDIEAYKKFLDTIEFNAEGSIRFLGDLFCERSMNDYPLLKLLEAMTKNGVANEILFSNHDLEFIEAYESFESRGKLVSQRFNQAVGRSLINLNILLEKGLVDKAEIFTIIDSVYKPSLKLLSYSINDEKNSFTLFTHAGIDLEVVKKITEKWNIPYSEDSIDALAKTFDLINEKFQVFVKTNTVHQLYDHDPVNSALAMAGNGQQIFPEEDPIIYLVWNRFYETLDRPLVAKAGFNLYFVHGHDMHEESHENIHNLDNNLGKDIDLNKGKYSVLYTVKSNYNLENQLEEKTTLENREIEGFEGSEENITSALSALASYHETSDTTSPIEPMMHSAASLIVNDFVMVPLPTKNPTIVLVVEDDSRLEKKISPPIQDLEPVLADKRDSESESNDVIIIGDTIEQVPTGLVAPKDTVREKPLEENVTNSLVEEPDSESEGLGSVIISDRNNLRGPLPKIAANPSDLEFLFEPRPILAKNKRHAFGELDDVDYSGSVLEKTHKYKLNPTEFSFLNKLKKIRKKGEELQDNFTEDSKVALDLHDTLNTYFYDYKENKISLDEFKISSKEAIQESRPALERHRGFKEILGNIALFIGMLGVGFVIAGLVKLAMTGGKEFLFCKFETDSGRKLNNLEEAVEVVAPGL